MIIAATLSLALLTQAVPAHDRAFWVSVAKNQFALPAGTTAFDLLVEMNALVASPDPELRDQIAYTAAERWIYRQRLLTTEQLRKVRELWLANLRNGIGASGDDSVFRRSFSALNLSLLAALDNDAPYLSQAEYEELLARSIEYLSNERDTRGYDRVKGWMHSPAHTADLLKFLARNRKLPPGSQGRILAAVSDRCASAGHVFTWGEDERLAQVVRSLVRREDLDAAAFNAWLTAFTERQKQLWAEGISIDPALFVTVQNMKQMLRAALVALSNDTELKPGTIDARLQLQRALK